MKDVRTTFRPADANGPLLITSVVLQRDAMLTFGYISALLILERWELAQMPPESLARSEEHGASSPSVA